MRSQLNRSGWVLVGARGLRCEAARTGRLRDSGSALGIPAMVSKLKRFANCKAGGLSRAQKPSTGYESGLHASIWLLSFTWLIQDSFENCQNSSKITVPSVPTLNFDPVPTPTAPPPPVPPLATQCRLRSGAEAALHRGDGAVQVQREATQGLAPVEGEGQHLGRHGGYGYGLGPLFVSMVERCGRVGKK